MSTRSGAKGPRRPPKTGGGGAPHEREAATGPKAPRSRPGEARRKGAKPAAAGASERRGSAAERRQGPRDAKRPPVAASSGTRKEGRDGKETSGREERSTPARPPRGERDRPGLTRGERAQPTRGERAQPTRGERPGKPGPQAAAAAKPSTPPAAGPKQPPPPPRPKPKKEPRPLPSGPPRTGSVALIGRPNVGKSTLLNAALGQPLAAVSHTPQTTRTALLGVLHHGSAEIALLDTPGLHRPRTELGRVMNEAAREATRGADVVVFVAEIPKTEILERAAERATSAAPARVHPGDVTLLADLPKGVPAILVLNKVDRVRNKGLILPTLIAFQGLHDFAAIVPISALREDGVAMVLDEIAKVLPEGAWRYGEDDVTDKPVRFFAAEYVREQILRATQDEVPHATAVGIEQFVEPAGRGAVQIDATIHVERHGQKKILVGAGGAMLKRVGTAARLRIEELVGRKVNLKLWVRVTTNWRDSARQIEELGYGVTSVDAPDVMLLAELDAEGEGDAEGDDDTTPGAATPRPATADLDADDEDDDLDDEDGEDADDDDLGDDEDAEDEQ